MHKVDLHTHSFVSPDGSLTADDYKHMLLTEKLNFIAVTDHNEVSFALKLHAEIGDRIIVGEEIMTSEGEIIGLFLQERIEPYLSPEETIAKIKVQNGLVYIPHPFESSRRSGVSEATLSRIVKDVDILEIYNGRAYIQDKSKQARLWADEHFKPGAASSDAHGRLGWGKTYSSILAPATRQSLVHLISSAELSERRVGLRGAMYPAINRTRKHPGPLS